MTTRLGAYGGMMGVVPAGYGGAPPAAGMGEFANYAIQTWPGSPLWGPSGTAFGAIGDLLVGGADAVGLGSVVDSVRSWWEDASPATRLLAMGVTALGFYMVSTSPSVRFVASHRGRQYLYAQNPRRRRGSRRGHRRNAGHKRHRPWSGAYGTTFQARYKSKSYRKRHNRRRSRR